MPQARMRMTWLGRYITRIPRAGQAELRVIRERGMECARRPFNRLQRDFCHFLWHDIVPCPPHSEGSRRLRPCHHGRK